MVAVVKCSACSPSTPTIRVRVPLTPTVFSVKFVFEKNKSKQKEVESSGYGRRLIFKGRGFESQHRIVNGHFSHLIVVKFECLFERTKINKKRPGKAIFIKKRICRRNWAALTGTVSF